MKQKELKLNRRKLNEERLKEKRNPYEKKKDMKIT